MKITLIIIIINIIYGASCCMHQGKSSTFLLPLSLSRPSPSFSLHSSLYHVQLVVAAVSRALSHFIKPKGIPHRRLIEAPSRSYIFVFMLPYTFIPPHHHFIIFDRQNVSLLSQPGVLVWASPSEPSISEGVVPSSTRVERATHLATRAKTSFVEPSCLCFLFCLTKLRSHFLTFS